MTYENEQPLITILTVTYNKLEYIYKTIDTVVMQDYPNIEFIISDDGSNVFPEQEIKEYVKINSKENIKNFLVIHHEKNVGTVRNLNYAYRQAKGEIFIPISGDDQFNNSSAITNIVKEFLKRKCDILVTGANYCDLDLNYLSAYPPNKIRKYIYKMNTGHKQLMKHIVGMDYSMAAGCLCSYTKEIHFRYGQFDESYDLYEDGPFIAKYLMNGGKIEYAYELLARDIRCGGISSTPNNPRLAKDLKLYHEMYLTMPGIAKNKWEECRLAYWYKILMTDNKYKKAIISICHPIFFLEYVIFSVRKRLYS